jgi:hypothetical protein
MIKLTVEANFETFKEFQKELQQNLIQNGLDKPLNEALDQLKLELNTLIDTGIRNVPESESEAQATGKINIAKSDEAILEHLTGVNLKEVNSTKNHRSFIDSKTCIVDKVWLGRAQKETDIVRLRVPISPGDTLETVFVKANTFFNETMFVVPNKNGTVNFKQNVGLNLAKYVKVVCSTDTGITDHSNYRFKKSYLDAGKGYVDFSLKASAFSELINKQTRGLLDITGYIDLIKDGKFDLAKSALDSAISVSTGKAQSTFQTLYDKVGDMQKGNMGEDLKMFVDTKALINSVTYIKDFTSDSVIYTIVADVTVDQSKIQDFYDKMVSKVNNWVIENHDIWYQRFVSTAKEIIKKYTGVYVS